MEKLCNVTDYGSEDELVLITVEPPELGDAREESDHTLNYELGQLGLSPQIVEDIVPDVDPAAKLEALGGAADELGDGGGGKQLRVGRVGPLQQPLTFS